MTESIVKLPIDRVESVILIIRGEKAILGADLAALYGVSTKRTSRCAAIGNDSLKISCSS